MVSLFSIPKFKFVFSEAGGNAGTGGEFMVQPAGYFRFGSSLSSPHCSDGLLSAFPELYSLEEKLAFSSSMHSLPTTDGIHCNSDAPISSFAYVTDSVVPDIPSLRRKVRVKGSSKPTIISETHSERLTDVASLESPAFVHTQESVLAMQSPLESSLSAYDAFLLKWDGVPIYSWWSHERSCMERLTLSVWELEEYIEACESLRGVRYTQYCQFDRDPPSFEQFDQMCETADQLYMESSSLGCSPSLKGSSISETHSLLDKASLQTHSTSDGAVFDDLLSLEGAQSFSPLSKPPTKLGKLLITRSSSHT